MKKLITGLTLLLALSLMAGAQETEPDASQIGVDSAQQRLQELSINKFEDPGFWTVSMPLDHGIIKHRRFEGSPQNKEPIEAEEEAGINEEDKYVVGLKVEYFARANTRLTLKPIRPMPVPGITKTISVWVVGRNFRHELSVVVEDFFGRTSTLPMGMLNFSGWKKLTVAVPPSLEQRNPHYNNQMGIKIIGFVIEPELTQTIGSYYVYFDDLRVETDLFAEESRDPDDIADNW